MIETRIVRAPESSQQEDVQQVVVISTGQMYDDDVSTLRHEMASTAGLSSLILSRCISPEIFPPVFEEADQYSTLEHLHLHDNKLGPEGGELLAEFLEGNYTVKQLKLSNNGIGASGAVALARVLQSNDTIENLDLREPSIGAEGLKALALALKTNKSLTSLTVAIAMGFEDAADALEEALRLNSTLESLTIIRWGQRVRLRRFDLPVEQILKWNTTLLRFNYAFFSNRGMAVRALNENRNMQKFLGSNMTEGVLSVALAKSKRPAMVYHVLRRHVDMAVRGLLD